MFPFLLLVKTHWPPHAQNYSPEFEILLPAYSLSRWLFIYDSQWVDTYLCITALLTLSFHWVLVEYLDEYLMVLMKFSFLCALFSFSLIFFFLFPKTHPLLFPPLLSSLSCSPFCPVSRGDGGAGSSLAHWHLPQREEWGHEQPAGHWQHGRSLLHAGGSHGPQPHHLHLRAPFLLAVPALLHGCLFWQTWHGLLHQQSKYFGLRTRSLWRTA